MLEKLKHYKGRGLLDETSLVGLCLFYLMSCISVFSRFTFLHRYNCVFIYLQDLARICLYVSALQPYFPRNPVFLFKIDFPSQIQIRVYLSIIKILPGYGRIWDRPHKVWFGKAAFYDVFELVSSNPDSLVSLLTSFIFKISCQDFSSRFFVGMR